MPFEFVDNNAPIDRDARKKIRSHVAIGRNVGKTHSRPSRKEAFVLPTKTRISKAVQKIPHLDSDESIDLVVEIERQIGDGLSVLCLPALLTLGSRSTVRKGMCIFTRECEI